MSRDSMTVSVRKSYYDIAHMLKEEDRLLFYDYLFKQFFEDGWSVPKSCPDQIVPYLTLIRENLFQDNRDFMNYIISRYKQT